MKAKKKIEISLPLIMFSRRKIRCKMKTTNENRKSPGHQLLHLHANPIQNGQPNVHQGPSRCIAQWWPPWFLHEEYTQQLVPLSGSREAFQGKCFTRYKDTGPTLKELTVPAWSKCLGSLLISSKEAVFGM